jgi:CHASE3 domain sensor protein
MGRLGLRAKLTIGFVMLLAMMVGLGGVAYCSIQKVTTATEAANTSLKKKETAALLEVAVRKQIQSANDNVFNGDAGSLQRYGKAREEVQQRLGETGQDVG